MIEEEEEEDLGPGEMTDPKSELGNFLIIQWWSSRQRWLLEKLSMLEIQVFTQKGLYTRRIMDEMGLTELNYEIGDYAKLLAFRHED